MLNLASPWSGCNFVDQRHQANKLLLSSNLGEGTWFYAMTLVGTREYVHSSEIPSWVSEMSTSRASQKVFLRKSWGLVGENLREPSTLCWISLFHDLGPGRLRKEGAGHVDIKRSFQAYWILEGLGVQCISTGFDFLRCLPITALGPWALSLGVCFHPPQ